MELLKETIEQKGDVLSENILKVDTFLNHLIEPDLMDEIGKEFARFFRGTRITKVMTIESGGIAPAIMTAVHLHVPLLFAKKAEPSTMTHPLTCSVHSFTKNNDYSLCVEKEAIEPDDRVLFIDDFLANGEAFKGICSLISQAGAELSGVGICIEKAWQNGRQMIDKADIPYLCLASIQSMSPENGIVWSERT